METVKDVLENCVVNEDDNTVKLPPVQLDRKLYEQVAKELKGIGGKWVGGKTQAFKFDHNPAELLQKQINGDKVNLQKDYQFFATPDAIADRLVELADINIKNNGILEPSAGDGAIVRAIHRVEPGVLVECCELMELNKVKLGKIPNCTILCGDFMQLHNKTKLTYDRIIANPPFTNNQDIDHVMQMWKMLAQGGRIVTIMSPHYQFASGKKEATFREWLSNQEMVMYELPAGAFKSSGTMIATVILVIDKKQW